MGRLGILVPQYLTAAGFALLLESFSADGKQKHKELYLFMSRAGCKPPHWSIYMMRHASLGALFVASSRCPSSV
jgi:hypothetical protein